MTDPEVLADIGLIPEGETLVEIPEDVLKLYLGNQQEDH